jgi:transcriptional regulator with XRE-family HTH domain
MLSDYSQMSRKRALPAKDTTKFQSLAATLAENVRWLRVSKGLTQAQIAVRAGLTKGHVTRLENGRYNVRLNTVSKLATALGVGDLELLPVKAAVWTVNVAASSALTAVLSRKQGRRLDPSQSAAPQSGWDSNCTNCRPASAGFFFKYL